MKAQVISFRCTLKNRLGQFISSSVSGEVVNQSQEEGSRWLRGLVAGLQNVKPGEKRCIMVSAEAAYGFYDPELAAEIPRSELKRGRKLKLGDELRMFSPERNCAKTFRVVGATPQSVFVDANHPLAGQDLVFDVEITSARELEEGEDGFPKPREARSFH
jgi:FKBP-type peptidyl-prolyl cis-trans isomerase SlyD